ncbi:MAG: hypothetical protein GX445_01645 [Elusimicrobia bacterium]|nr:hypothetical protein [Elusimicrobiota bacterium]
MKKYIILVLVILIIVSGVYYLRSSKKPSLPIKQSETYINNESLTPNQLERSTISFQSQNRNTNINYSEIAKKQMEEMMKASSTLSDISTSYNNSSLPPQYAQMINCNKNVDDIISDYGKIWGNITIGNIKDKKTKTYTFAKEEQDNINQLLLNYQSCISFVRNDSSVCKKIPSSKECKKIFDNQISYYLLLDYINGKNNNIDNCINNISNSPEAAQLMGSLTLEKACQMIHGVKVKNVCDKINSVNNLGNNIKFCYKLFSKGDSCQENNEQCNISIAFAKSNPDLCPNNSCKAFISKDEKTCDNMKAQLLITYCDYYNSLMNRKKVDEEKTNMNEKMKKKNSNEENDAEDK